MFLTYLSAKAKKARRISRRASYMNEMFDSETTGLSFSGNFSGVGIGTLFR